MTDYKATTREAVENAREVVRENLRANLPGVQVGPNSVLGDLLVDGHAVVFQFLRDQLEIARNQQSLLRIQNLPESESASDAADAILSNFLRTRAQGKFAKGAAQLLFSSRVDVLVPARNVRFFKTPQLVFYLDSDTDLFIPASELRPVLDGNGVVQAYYANVFLTAARTGAAYNIPAGTFAGFDRFNALLLGVQNNLPFEGGEGVQSTADFVAGSGSAISLRALVNARSNDSVLTNEFDSTIVSTTTVGYGDPEMVRDLVQLPGSATKLHVGGHMDVYVRQPVREVVDRLTVGGLSVRNDGKPLIFRHTGTTPSGSFVVAGVKPGHILRIDGGLPAPAKFRIVSVDDEQLEVEPAFPFATATDTATSPIAVSYSVGTNYPTFDNTIGATTSVDAKTSALFSQKNRVQMPALPVQRIKRVEIVAPYPVELQPYADPATGSVVFTAQKNAPTLAAPGLGEELGFFVECLTPELANSANAVVMLEVGWRSFDLGSVTVQVTYDTPADFSSVHAYVSDRNVRNSNSSTLVRAPHTIYLYASIPYKQRTSPINPLSTEVPIFDEVGAQAALQTYLSGYRELEPVDAQLLGAKAREASNGAATIFTFRVMYTLPLPTGKLMQFETSDVVTIFPDEVTSSARLLNPQDFGLPTSGYAARLRSLLESYGLSDRVTRYVASSGAIVFERRS